MIFTETALRGAFIVDLERHEDIRGSFARLYCHEEFMAQGLNPVVPQVNIATNRRCATVRGMHYQLPPFSGMKYVRCVRGALLDVIVDLRPESATYLRHVAVELSALNQRGLYVPERFAHGYETLEDDTDALYLMGEPYNPAAEGGLCHDDPMLGLSWPISVAVLSEKDKNWKSLEEFEPKLRECMAVSSAVLSGTP
jgi:dTDP-4-dehydrorhamnose 3,5-epimerase